MSVNFFYRGALGRPLENAEMDSNLQTMEFIYAKGAEFDASASAGLQQIAGFAGIYQDTAAGLAATSSGEYFSVVSADANESVLLYLNSGGSAVLQKTYPSSDGVPTLVLDDGDPAANRAWSSAKVSSELAYKADDASVTAALATKSPSASPTFTGAIEHSGSQRSNVVAMANNTVDCSAGNYFIRTISGNATFTFSNVPASCAYSFTLELTHTSGTITWPAAVRWPGGLAPTLTTGKTHLFMFVTDDGGTRWRGAALADYET